MNLQRRHRPMHLQRGHRHTHLQRYNRHQHKEANGYTTAERESMLKESESKTERERSIGCKPVRKH